MPSKKNTTNDATATIVTPDGETLPDNGQRTANPGAAFARAANLPESKQALRNQAKDTKANAPKGPSAQENRERIANKIMALVAAGDWSDDDKQKVANWNQHLPVTEWPESLPRPTTKRWARDETVAA